MAEKDIYTLLAEAANVPRDNAKRAILALGYGADEETVNRLLHGDPTKLFELEDPVRGLLRLEHWPEGYVLWVGGEVAWRSWKK